MAIGPTSSVTGVGETLLLSIDTSSEQILRCVPILSSAFGGSNYLNINASTSNQPVYIIGYSSQIGEFDPESLALVRSYRCPAIPLRPQITPIVAIRPATDGRIWVLDSLKTLSLFNPATSAYELVLPARTETRTYLSPAGDSLYTFAFDNQNPPTTATLRRLDIKGQELEQAAERVVALVPNRVWYEAYPFLTPAPFRLGFQNAAYDTDLNLVADLEDPLNRYAQSTDGSLFGSHLLYLGDTYSDIRIIPSPRLGEYFRCYEALSRKIVTYANLKLEFTSIDSLPRSLTPSLKMDKLSDTSATFTWEQAPVLGAYSAEQVVKDLAYRVAGSGSEWNIITSSFHRHAHAPCPPSRDHLRGSRARFRRKPRRRPLPLERNTELHHPHCSPRLQRRDMAVRFRHF